MIIGAHYSSRRESGWISLRGGGSFERSTSIKDRGKVNLPLLCRRCGCVVSQVGCGFFLLCLRQWSTVAASRIICGEFRLWTLLFCEQRFWRCVLRLCRRAPDRRSRAGQHDGEVATRGGCKRARMAVPREFRAVACGNSGLSH
jgi:hypothetical protein